ncbi:MAG: hydrogenase 3 maturation endopeptidase HyCI [Verrucomicrobia bacterium]|nr:hydrogenase 3 maturation endopeptidase HyCI [Verrucomicrobiota bacterium]
MTHLRPHLQAALQGRVCLVGVGNPDRGDDSLGLRLAERLRAPSWNVLLAGTTPERHLASLAAAAFDHVVFLDAVDFGGPPGSVVLLDADQIQTRRPQVSTHKLSLGLLARCIETNGTTRAWLLGVQPAACRWGHPLSPPAQSAVDSLATLLNHIAASAPEAGPDPGRNPAGTPRRTHEMAGLC